MSEFDPAALFERLGQAGVDYVVIGGWAVNAHGHRRLTGDLDICPDPAPANLKRLARLLSELHADHLGAGDFDAEEIPGDPTDPDSLAAGGNFRVMTDLGVLDVMQWIPGLETDDAFSRLAADARGDGLRGSRARLLAGGAAGDEARRRPPDRRAGPRGAGLSAAR